MKPNAMAFASELPGFIGESDFAAAVLSAIRPTEMALATASDTQSAHPVTDTDLDFASPRKLPKPTASARATTLPVLDWPTDDARAVDEIPPTASDPDTAIAFPSAVCAVEATFDSDRIKPVPTPRASEPVDPLRAPAELAAVPLPSKMPSPYACATEPASPLPDVTADDADAASESAEMTPVHPDDAAAPSCVVAAEVETPLAVYIDPEKALPEDKALPVVVFASDAPCDSACVAPTACAADPDAACPVAVVAVEEEIAEFCAATTDVAASNETADPTSLFATAELTTSFRVEATDTPKLPATASYSLVIATTSWSVCSSP
jgi:hypothetical protein